MTPDVYAAFLTAGDRLQPYGAWIARNWPNLAAALLLAVFAAWCIRRACHGLGDASRRVDTILADQPRPGTDICLYLDCIAIYDDSDELDRLRDAIKQHRTGEK